MNISMRNKWQRIRAALLLAAMLFSFSCRAEKTGEPVIFTDDLGRQIVLSQTPERTASLIGSFADIWLLAGGTLCAAPEDAWEELGVHLADALCIGGAHSPNPELIFAANPDFVIASASTASNVELKDVFEAAGICVAYFDVDNFADYLRMLDICTDITGRKDLYAQNGLQIRSRIEEIRTEFENAALPEEKRTVLLLRAYSANVKAKGSRGTILGEMLADLGCINIADGDASLLETLSLEGIIRREPYHIFMVTMGDDTEAAMRSLEQMIQENPAWKSIEAVAEGRIHLMDRRLFNNKPNAKWAQAYEKLSDILLEKE